MSDVPVVRFWHDFYCPWSYTLRVRLEKVRGEYAGRLRLRFMSLPLEVINKQPTPKNILDVEWPICAMQEPAARFRYWSAEEWKWPATMLPAFEAAKAAERQGEDLAARFDLAVREAFFSESRTICMRHVLLELAGQAGLDASQFQQDFDSGTHRRTVLEELVEARELGVRGSPALVLPDGEVLSNFTLTLPKFTPDHKIAQVSAPEYSPAAALDKLREVLDRAVGRSASKRQAD
jgi:predicted DsbA family dithiol-disulfide isomerase